MNEFQIVEEQSRRHLGAAKIFLEHLFCSTRELDSKNVTRLQNVFRNLGCRRLEPNNRVPVLITQEQFDHISRENGNPDFESSDPPILRTNIRLECLHGMHRLAAGRNFLRGAERWWCADLILADSLYCILLPK